MLRRTLWILGCYCVLQNSLFADSPKENKATAKIAISPADQNLRLGKTFLEENRKNPDIHTLPSGLQYKISKEGEGNPPGPTDFVSVKYKGTLVDGTEFDSSYNHQAPITLAVNATIPGWVEALQLMKPGAQWTIYLPPHLAYGNKGAGRLIGPNATLIFDIELLAVKPSLIGEHDDAEFEMEDEG